MSKLYKGNRLYSNLSIKELDNLSEGDLIPFGSNIIANLITGKHKFNIFHRYKIQSLQGNSYLLKINDDEGRIVEHVEGNVYTYKFKGRTVTLIEIDGVLYTLYSFKLAVDTLEKIIKMVQDRFILECNDLITFSEIIGACKDRQIEEDTYKMALNNPIHTEGSKALVKKKRNAMIHIFKILQNSSVIYKQKKQDNRLSGTTPF